MSQQKVKPTSQDSYKKAKDSRITMIMTDKDGKQTILKR